MFVIVYHGKNRKNILSETSKSVCRYVKSGDLEKCWQKNFWIFFLLKIVWNPKKLNKKLDPPHTLPWHLKYFQIYGFTMVKPAKQICLSVCQYRQKMACLISIFSKKWSLFSWTSFSWKSFPFFSFHYSWVKVCTHVGEALH